MQLGADFLLLLSFVFFLGGVDAVCALLLADAVHELGHVLALVLSGTEIAGFELRASGAVLRCGVFSSRGCQALCVAAGPAAGLVFGALCMLVPDSFFRYTGTAALLASGFNLLPIAPLDGGQLLALAAEARLRTRQTERILRLAGTACACGILLFCAYCHWIAGIAMGIYLTVLVNFPQMR